ncbi:MAG: isoprenylcysteine carboxylmethyltransferase family protein [Microterricola sp.]
MGLVRLLQNVPVPPAQAVGLVVGVALERLRPARLPGPTALHRATGVALVAMGCAVILMALTERRRRTDGAFEMERPQSLVTTGPYAFSRHPMYAGWWLAHLGVGMTRGSAWVFATVPLAALAEHRGVLSEERELVRMFGREYEEYAARTPRYLVVRAHLGPSAGTTFADTGTKTAPGRRNSGVSGPRIR